MDLTALLNSIWWDFLKKIDGVYLPVKSFLLLNLLGRITESGVTNSSVMKRVPQSVHSLSRRILLGWEKLSNTLNTWGSPLRLALHPVLGHFIQNSSFSFVMNVTMKPREYTILLLPDLVGFFFRVTTVEM